MKGTKRSASPTGEATTGRVVTQSTPKGGSTVLGYALKGQLVARPIPHKGKVKMPMGTGYYPSPSVGPGKHSGKM